MAFQYQDYHDPLVGTLGSLIGEEGRIRAQAALQAGEARARAAQNIGGAVSGAVQDIAQYRADAPRRQLLALQVQSAQEDAAARRAARADQEQAKHADVAARIGMRVHLEGNTPEALQGAFNDLERANLITADDVQRLASVANQDPSKIPQLSQSLMALSPTGQAFLEKLQTPKPLINRDPTHDLVDPVTHQVVLPGTARPPNPSFQSKSVLLDGEPQEVSFDANTGKYVFNGEDVTGRVQPVKTPKARQAEWGVVDGKKVALWFDPETGKRYDAQGTDVTAKVQPIPPAALQVPGNGSDVKESVAGMKDGTLPPQLPGRASKDYTAIMAEAHRQGYDLAAAASDWAATQKHIATLNGSKLTALRSSIETAYESLDVIDELAKKWDAGRFPLLNKANLVLAKGGAFGNEAASIASQLEGQITDVTSELGNVYMGGNSPTDHALKLAEKNLSASWDKKVLLDMTQLARKNLQIRKNSINHSTPAGLSTDAPSAPATSLIEAKDPQGNIHHAPAGTPLPDGWTLVKR